MITKKTIEGSIKRSIDKLNQTLDDKNKIKFPHDRIESILAVSLVAQIEQDIKDKLNLIIHLKYLPVKFDVLVDHVWFSLPRKLVITDLDNTMWDGVIGENFDVRPRYAYMHCLAEFSKQGAILSIASKNTSQLAEAALDKYLAYGLSKEMFVHPKINWDNKANNIRLILAELNLGPEALVFIDDSPFEREAISIMFPDTLVVHPDDVSRLNCFYEGSTWEDEYRPQMYQEEQDRQQFMEKEKDHLHKMKFVATIRPFGVSNIDDIDRVVQLINKVNQMNLTTRRLTRPELINWFYDRNHRAWTFRLQDKFGNYGLIGFLSVDINEGRIIDFIISCRAMGRGVEELMFHQAIEQIRVMGGKEVLWTCIPTERNQPCQQFFSGIIQLGEPEYPYHIKVRYGY